MGRALLDYEGFGNYGVSILGAFDRDEEKLGFTYDTLDAYIRDGIVPETQTKERIDRLYAINRFKVRYMDVFPYSVEE